MKRLQLAARVVLVFPLIGAGVLACGGQMAEPQAAPTELQPSVEPREHRSGGIPVPGPTSDGCEASAQVVHFETLDGVGLEGDLHTTGRVHDPAVVLLHMIPPRFDRTGYPEAFIRALRDSGMNVLNVDRRGAGKSAGVAKDAYMGLGGQHDVAAAVKFLAHHRCKPDPTRLILIGASNGTTSALDYTLHASIKDGGDIHDPAALVFLTGGRYTENQNRIEENMVALRAKPILFVFSTDERDWSVGFKTAKAPGVWRFDEYPEGRHGTKLFAADPASIDRVATWVAESVAR